MSPTSGSKKPLHVKVADILRTEIGRSTQGRLPNLRKLSLHYKVSYVTMSRAVQLLKSHGLIDVSRGRQISVVQPTAQENQLQSQDTAVARLARQVNETIENGQYRVGQFLPKYLHFTLSNHVSSGTVAQAYALLGEKQKIHKSGSRWVVGPPPQAYSRLSVAKHGDAFVPTVLMLLPGNPRAYQDLYNAHSQPFMGEFLAQMARFKIRWLLVQSEREPSAIPMFPCGKKEILALIQSCKDHFLGTLIPVQLSTFPDLKEWIEWLLQFKKPVVWFDFMDSGASFDRDAHRRGEYYRCCSNEFAMVDVVLETCSRLGHRTLGCPLYYPYTQDIEGWFPARRTYLEQAVKKQYADLALLFPKHEEALWKTYDPEYQWDQNPESLDNPQSLNRSGHRTGNPMRGHIDFCAKSLREHHKNVPEHAFKAIVQREIFASVPSLSNLVHDKDVTAILAPNQWLAINYLEWMHASGIQVPRELSLVSFDNYYHQSMYPITVVDQNFGELGYKSAHIFIKDIQVQADKAGRIVSNPTMIDRGSLGRPRPRGR